MSPLPKEAKDLALAPVAVEIDLNLQRLRAKSPEEIQLELETELDDRSPGTAMNAPSEFSISHFATSTRGIGLP